MEELPTDVPMAPQVAIVEEKPFELPPAPRGGGMKVTIVAIIIMLVAGGAGAGYKYFLKDKISALKLPKPTQPITGEQLAPIATEQPTPTPEEPAQTENTVCDAACFNQKFITCEAAITDFVVSDQLAYHDEIVGISPSTGLCGVRVSFGANPNPDLLGKDMICEYNNSLLFSEAVKDSSRCSGELYDAVNTAPSTNSPEGGSTYQEAANLFADALIKQDITEALRYVAVFERTKVQQMLNNMGSQAMEFVGHAIQEGAVLDSPDTITDQTTTISMSVRVFDNTREEEKMPLVLVHNFVDGRWYIRLF